MIQGSGLNLTILRKGLVLTRSTILMKDFWKTAESKI